MFNKLKTASSATMNLNVREEKPEEGKYKSFYEKLALGAFSNIYNGRKLDKYRTNEWIDR